MAWIKTILPKDATGLLERLYKQAIERAGKVFQVVQLQSLRPRALRASIQLYKELMHVPEDGLSRAQREMIATVVSKVNHCEY